MSMMSKDKNALGEMERIGNTVGGFILSNEIDKALKNILFFLQFSTEMLSEERAVEKSEKSGSTLYISINAVRSLSILLAPFIPFSAVEFETNIIRR